MYHPGSADPNRASALDLHAGDELPEIDFALTPVKTFRVRGRVYDAASGRPGMREMILLEERNPKVRSWSYHSNPSVQNPQGKFEIRGVKPGSYYVLALSQHDDKRYTARESIEVSDADVEGVSLFLGPGIDLKGRIRVEGNAPLDPNVVNIWLQPYEEVRYMGNTRPSIEPDGTFVISNVADGDYQLSIRGLPEDFYLKAGRAGGSDVLTSDLRVSRKQPPGPLELVLSPNPGHVEGRVLKEDKPFGGATVVLVPEGTGVRWSVYMSQLRPTKKDGLRFVVLLPMITLSLRGKPLNTMHTRTLNSCVHTKTGANRSIWTKAAGSIHNLN